MNRQDLFTVWRANPFFVLEVPLEASPAEIERAGQKLLALLAVGSDVARFYQTPFGPAARDAYHVRQALAALRDPQTRILHELWADVAQRARQTKHIAEVWEDAERALGWTEKWPA